MIYIQYMYIFYTKNMAATVDKQEYETLKTQYDNLVEAFHDFKELDKNEIPPELSEKIHAVKNSDTSYYSDLQEKYA